MDEAVGTVFEMQVGAGLCWYLVIGQCMSLRRMTGSGHFTMGTIMSMQGNGLQAVCLDPCERVRHRWRQ